MATINDVAAHAGVSIKTVSRVLNNEPHVREVLRERVLTAARELDYQPNQAARRMAGKRSFLIAFVYRNPDPPYVAGVQSGAAEYCREHGYHLVIEPVPLDREQLEQVLLRLARVLAPDAVFVAPPLSDDAEFIEIAERIGISLIRIAGQVGGAGQNIEIDDREPACEVVRHLVGLGHRRIAFVRPPREHLTASARYEGYREAMLEAGLDIHPAMVVEGEFTFASGYDAAQHLWAGKERPTAIFAANDAMALGVMAAVREMGVAVPGELSIAGFDDIPAASTTWPPLTTVRQPFAAYGIAAVALAIEGRLPEAIDLRSSLVIRGTTAPPEA